jgi:hypothetical protein
MTRLTFDISMSLDGFVAGPNATLEEPLGEGGEQLHEWTVRLASWRERHGMSGGETGPDDDVARESIGAAGAFLMGRRMFSGGQGPWADDPKADAWWGDEPPFRVPVFVPPTILASPSRSRGEPRTRSSPTASSPHSSGLGTRPATSASRLPAAQVSFSSTSTPVWWTTSSSTSSPSCSAAACACSRRSGASWSS